MRARPAHAQGLAESCRPNRVGRRSRFRDGIEIRRPIAHPIARSCRSVASGRTHLHPCNPAHGDPPPLEQWTERLATKQWGGPGISLSQQGAGRVSLEIGHAANARVSSLRISTVWIERSRIPRHVGGIMVFAPRERKRLLKNQKRAGGKHRVASEAATETSRGARVNALPAKREVRCHERVNGKKNP